MNTITSTRGTDPADTVPAPAGVVAHDISCDPGCPFCLGPETD